jgi:hypothetical protein
MTESYLKCPKCGWTCNDIELTTSKSRDDLGYCQECDEELEGEEPVYIHDLFEIKDEYGNPITMSYEYDNIIKKNLFKIDSPDSCELQFTKEQLRDFVTEIHRAVLKSA